MKSINNNENLFNIGDKIYTRINNRTEIYLIIDRNDFMYRVKRLDRKMKYSGRISYSNAHKFYKLYFTSMLDKL
jgi:lipid A disaccharide synthetase